MPAEARVLRRPSRPEISILGWPVMSRPSSVVDHGVLGGGLGGDLVFAGGDRVRRTHLELDVLGLAGIERQRIELLAAVLLGEGGVEVLRRLGGEADQQLLAALVLDVSWYSKVDFELPRRSGSCGETDSLAGRSVAKRHGDRQRDLGRRALGGDREVGRADRRILGHVEPQLERDAGVGGRQRRRDRLAAAHQGRRPARGTPGHRQREPLGRQRIVLQAQVDGRGGARPQRDGGIVGQEEQPLDVVLGSLRAAAGPAAEERDKTTEKKAITRYRMAQLRR